jgi:RNA-directed DNA polymerase
MGGIEKGRRLQCRKTPAERRCTGRGTGEVVVETIGVPWFLDDLRAALRDCGPGRPGSAEAVLEPVFEAGLEPVSQGYRPGGGGKDAIAEMHHFATHGYRWVLDADIEACLGFIVTLLHC